MIHQIQKKSQTTKKQMGKVYTPKIHQREEGEHMKHADVNNSS